MTYYITNLQYCQWLYSKYIKIGYLNGYIKLKKNLKHIYKKNSAEISSALLFLVYYLAGRILILYFTVLL